MGLHDIPGLLDNVEAWQPLDETLAWQPNRALGNAERLRARFRENLLYVDSIGWHAWDKRRWNLVSGESDALLYSHKTALAIRGQVRALEAVLTRRIFEGGGAQLDLSDVRAFVQRWFGYNLTGLTSEQAFLVMYGEGANGKSTMLEALRPVFGDYGATVDMNSFLHNDRQRGSDASPDFARLPDIRLATAAEINTGDRLSEKTVKSITGGEAMTARQLHKPFFEFYPVFKLILSCNQKPVIRGQDKGIWRRVLLLPFTRSFDKSEIDKHLVEKLRREGPGILNWCLDGYREWREKGLQVPDAVLEATEGYRTDSDPVGEFLATALGPKQGSNVTARDLYQFYQRWAKVNGISPISETGFGKRAKQRLAHKKIGIHYYIDIQIMQSAIDAVVAAEDRDKPPDDDGRSTPPPPEGDL
ncbi:MAG: phage/plasmid primase, P4 family [Pseudomonadota bacterium]